MSDHVSCLSCHRLVLKVNDRGMTREYTKTQPNKSTLVTYATKLVFGEVCEIVDFANPNRVMIVQPKSLERFEEDGTVTLVFTGDVVDVFSKSGNG